MDGGVDYERQMEKQNRRIRELETGDSSIIVGSRFKIQYKVRFY
jgi:hypothetical protein